MKSGKGEFLGLYDLTEHALRQENIVARRCFLCGGAPTKGVGEHVFPRWLQRRFELWDHTLTLQNGTFIPYRDVRVPACEDCNNRVLGRAETYVSALSAADVASWTSAHSFEVGRWLAKILVGILIKEASLPRDRSDPSLGKIFSSEGVSDLKLLHLLVQTWRKPVHFQTLHAPHPFTLYVYEIERDEGFSHFDFSTNLFGKSVSIRLGELGFIFVADGGLQHEMGALGPYNLGFQRLHPVQFGEVSARVHYKSVLRDATHLYSGAETPDGFSYSQVRVVPNTSTKLEDGSDRVFREWSDREFALMLRNYQAPGWEYLLDDIGEAVYTYLVDENGAKRTIPAGSFS